MTDDAVIRGLPFGAGAVLALVIVVGFVALLGFQAWMHGVNFIVPVRDMLAVLVVVMLLFTLALMIGNNRMTEGGDILLGAVIAGFAAIVAFYFRLGGGGKDGKNDQ